MTERKHPNAVCETCPLKGMSHVPSTIPKEPPQLVIVGEAPGRNEVRLGAPFVGESGKLLRAVLKHLAVDLDQIMLTNSVMCRPPGNAKPAQEAQWCCETRLLTEIVDSGASKNTTILALGLAAREALMPGISGGITIRMGEWWTHPDLEMPITSCIHPAAVLRGPSDNGWLFLQGLQKALTGPPPVELTLLSNVKHKTIASWEELRNLLPKFRAAGTVVYDLETDQVDWTRDDILCIGMAISPTEAYVVPMDLLYGEGRPFLGLLLEQPDIRYVAHNGRFDVHFLRHQLGINARVDFDTMLAHYVLNELKGTHALKLLAVREFGIPDYEKELVQAYLKSRNDRYSKVPATKLHRYCALDVAVTYKLYEHLNEQLHTQELYEHPFLEPLMRTDKVLLEAELTGMPVDESYLLEQMVLFEEDIDQWRQRLRDLGEKPLLNPNSFKQVAAIMYDKLGAPIVTGRGVKPRSTNRGAMEMLSHHPRVKPDSQLAKFIKALKMYRRVSKLNSSYLQNIYDQMTEQGRVHATFQLHGTEVGRLSVRNPALQTIPRKDNRETGEYGTRIKRAFRAPKGRKIVHCDYSQAELRVFAALTKDPFLLKVYREDRDLHTEVALSMFGPDFSPADRVHCKMFNFSYVYGGTANSFAIDTGIPIGAAKDFVRKYNEQMPLAAMFKKDTLDLVRRQGYVTSLFNRRRRFPIINNANIDEVRKASVHFLVASAASDLTITSMCFIHDALPEGANVILTVHDSVLVECNDEQVPQVARLMKTTFEDIGNRFIPEVPWRADVEAGQTWADLEEV